jgi:hypothetical protein
MISAVPSVSSVHVELDGRLPSTAGRTDETTKGSPARGWWKKKFLSISRKLLEDGVNYSVTRGFRTG